MLLMVQSSDAEVLVLRCPLSLSPDCNSLWFNTGMVWFQTRTPDKAGYHPVLLSVFRLEQAFTGHCCPSCTHWPLQCIVQAFTRRSCPSCTHWLRFDPLTLVNRILKMVLRKQYIPNYLGYTGDNASHILVL